MDEAVRSSLNMEEFSAVLPNVVESQTNGIKGQKCKVDEVVNVDMKDSRFTTSHAATYGAGNDEETATPGLNLCAQCGEVATLKCNACSGAPAYDENFSSSPPNYYCNTGCQKANWKTGCKQN